jgi:hypothetical protein
MFKVRQLLLVFEVLDIFWTVDTNSTTFDVLIGEDTFINECKIGRFNAVICAFVLTY